MWPTLMVRATAQVVDRVATFLVDLLHDRDRARVALIGHVATRWALDHLLIGVPLEDLVRAQFDWRAGWSYTLPSGWTPGMDAKQRGAT
jgi:2,3-bisphosphoglycerate-dependent phosphoglycerate mutase